MKIKLVVCNMLSNIDKNKQVADVSQKTIQFKQCLLLSIIMKQTVLNRQLYLLSKIRRAIGPGRDRQFLFFALVCLPPFIPPGTLGLRFRPAWC